MQQKVAEAEEQVGAARSDARWAGLSTKHVPLLRAHLQPVLRTTHAPPFKGPRELSRLPPARRGAPVVPPSSAPQTRALKDRQKDIKDTHTTGLSQIDMMADLIKLLQVGHPRDWLGVAVNRVVG